MLVGLYGAGNLGGQISNCLPFDHVFVDDTPSKQGKTHQGKKIITLQDFVKMSKHQNHMLYICIMLPCYDIKQKIQEIKEKYSIQCEPFTALLLHDAKAVLPFLFFEAPDELEEKLPRYEKIKASLGDELSQSVLSSHIHLRLTGDFNQLLVTDRADLPFLDAALEKRRFHYVDCGAYDGETATALHRQYTDQLKSVTIVEPDPDNLRKINLHLSQYDFSSTPCEIIEAAISSTSGEAHFVSGMSTASSLSDEGELIVKTIRLSDLKVPSPSYIKLDIEGAECETILSSKSYLLEERPLLGISVYHGVDDLLEISEFLLKSTNYKLFLRCHGPNGEDLMLYAI